MHVICSFCLILSIVFFLLRNQRHFLVPDLASDLEQVLGDGRVRGHYGSRCYHFQQAGHGTPAANGRSGGSTDQGWIGAGVNDYVDWSLWMEAFEVRHINPHFGSKSARKEKTNRT
jgi:hypothetical protein